MLFQLHLVVFARYSAYIFFPSIHVVEFFYATFTSSPWNFLHGLPVWNDEYLVSEPAPNSAYLHFETCQITTVLGSRPPSRWLPRLQTSSLPWSPLLSTETRDPIQMNWSVEEGRHCCPYLNPCRHLAVKNRTTYLFNISIF